MGLSGGAIAGIVIGALVVGALLLVLGEPVIPTAAGAALVCHSWFFAEVRSKLTIPTNLPIAPVMPIQVFWHLSAERKRKEQQEEAAAVGAGKLPGSSPALAQAPSDRGFFLNLVPSFKRR